MFVGEIGIPRREFLYEIHFWEARRIIRGYRRRYRLTQQLLAENVYASTFAFRGANGTRVSDMFPFLFQEEGHEPDAPPSTEEEQEELRQLMRTINAQRLNKQKSGS